ncbi:MAG: hypothetical protein WBR31_11495, partial [Candidatus Sulfotelmatobacter sp.]
QRNIEVDPHEDTVTVQREIADRKLGHWLVRPQSGATYRVAPARSRKSTPAPQNRYNPLPAM